MVLTSVWRYWMSHCRDPLWAKGNLHWHFNRRSQYHRNHSQWPLKINATAIASATKMVRNLPNDRATIFGIRWIVPLRINSVLCENIMNFS